MNTVGRTGGDAEGCEKKPVFINDVELIKQPQEVLGGIRTVVGLNSFDNLLNPVIVHSLDRSRQSCSVMLTGYFQNRKVSPL